MTDIELKDDAEIVRENYNKNAEKEWQRLEGFSFEFEITKRFLFFYMHGKTVLDIGGGQGRYSIYLAQQGFDVTMVDLSENNIAIAKEKFSQYGVNVKAYVCDARNLSCLNLGKFDNVLLMGPLYHLTVEEDRAACVLQAKQHLSENGVLFASFITLTAGLNYYFDHAPDQLINEPALDLFDRMEKDESWSGMAFTRAFFVNSREVLPFFEKLGFEKITLLGQEGIVGPRLGEIECADEKVRRLYFDICLRVCENPQYFAYSQHLLYIGKAKR